MHRQLVCEGVRPRVGRASRAETNHERPGRGDDGEEPVRSDAGAAGEVSFNWLSACMVLPEGTTKSNVLEVGTVFWISLPQASARYCGRSAPVRSGKTRCCKDARDPRSG